MTKFKYDIVRNFLSSEEIKIILDNPELPACFEVGLLVSYNPKEPHGAINLDERDQKVAWIQEGTHTSFQWLFDRIKMSALVYPLPIDPTELYGIQFGLYGEGNYFKMHTDSDGYGVDPRNRRMLSVTILLEDADEGGEFEFDQQDIPIKMNQGDAIFFDSTLKHQVKEVKRGTRKSLVIWLNAPKDYQPANDTKIYEINLPTNFDRQGLIKYIDEHAEDLDAGEEVDSKIMVGCYKPPIGEKLLHDLLPTIKEILNEEDLWVCNSFVRVYNINDTLKKHIDRDGLDYAVTFNLYRDHPWSIMIGSREYPDNDPNIGYLFKASKIPHERPEPYQGEKCYQLFLHYTKDKTYEFDNRPGTAVPSSCTDLDMETIIGHDIFTHEQCAFLLNQYDDVIAKQLDDFSECKSFPADKIIWQKAICEQINMLTSKTHAIYNTDSYVCSPQIIKWPKDYSEGKLHSDYGSSNQYPWREFTAIIPLSESGIIVNIPKLGQEFSIEKNSVILFKGGVLSYEVRHDQLDDCYCLVIFFAPKADWEIGRPEWPPDNFMQICGSDDNDSKIEETIEASTIINDLYNKKKFNFVNDYVIATDFPARELIGPHAEQMITEFLPDYDIDPTERDGYNKPYDPFPFRIAIAEKFVKAARSVFDNVTDNIYEENGYLRTEHSQIIPHTYIQNNILGSHVWHHHIRTATVNAVIYYDVPKIGGELELFTAWGKETIKLKPEENKIYFFPYYTFHRPCPQEDTHWRININIEILQKERLQIHGTNIMW